MMRQALTLIMLVSSACTPISTQECTGSWSCHRPHWLGMQQGLTIRVNLKGSDELWDDAALAIEWWNSHAQRALFVLSIDDAAADVHLTVGTTAESHLGHTRVALDVEKCEIKNANIVISDKIDEGEWRSQTIAHELGHSVGLDHDPNEDDLMFCVQSCKLDDCLINPQALKTL